MKRKGFTLVELLIVIVVIGILSAMMMLSSTEAVTSARASNIVSNLRNFKTAAMAMYVDHMDTMDAGKLPDSTTESQAILVKYMNKGGSSANGVDYTGNYHLKLMKPTSGTYKDEWGWYVYAKNVTDLRVQEKLAGRAGSVGLLKADGTGDYVAGTNGTDQPVYMFVTKIDASQTAAETSTETSSGSSGGTGN